MLRFARLKITKPRIWFADMLVSHELSKGIKTDLISIWGNGRGFPVKT
ncbi:MAG: hypothetical protein SRB1_00532 [Desulfobacteraceae bacterium Eth-SRB1]|nr:MAG: hypothetical protein SRB1_00532 [Desulfobacteraceae bacterium Eth-SRB1]